MRLLQALRGLAIAGCGATARSIIQALPDWHHTIVSSTDSESVLRTAHPFSGQEARVAPIIDARVFRSVRPDAVILHNILQSECPGIGTLRDVPTMYYYHASYSGIQPLAEQRELMDACSSVMCVSRFLADQIGLPADRVLYQPVTVPIDETARPSAPLVVGRLCNPISRNWRPEVVDFYAFLAASHPHICWEFVGCPPDLAERLSRSCGGRARFHEATPEAPLHYSGWHAILFSNSSVTHGYGRTVCEAQTVGCIPIVDKKGGFIEQITHGETGFLCTNLSEFAAALAELSDHQRRRTMGESMRLGAEQRGSPRVWRERFLSWYREHEK